MQHAISKVTKVIINNTSLASKMFCSGGMK